MIRSMTAFAREGRQGDWGTLSLELRSVNHRYLEVTVRAPEEIRALEATLRERIGRRLKRGKVDCNIRYQPPAELPGELEINRELVSNLAHVSREIDTLLYSAAPVNSLEVLRWPGVLQMPTPDPERVKAEVLTALDGALGDLIATREREGEKLKSVILQRCDAMQPVVAQVREHLPEILQRLRERMRERLAEIKADVDEGRLEQELVMQAQKMDVEEELDRLDTHLAEVRRVLEQDEPVGRRLDFLMQELNREANTLASKSADVDNTRCAVDLKVFIEQMREQVQNIE